ncbi:MAG: HEAT repeat domain-containing protein [Dehalococcoidales bacterium]|nr:HEAT repeat domain-containing protein [Dehalococcoidales bacterium]
MPKSDTPPPIAEVIAGLANGREERLSSRLAGLSDLSREELELLDQTWERIKPKRRRQIMHRLVELAEDNTSLSFDGIYKHRLRDIDHKVRTLAIEGLWENEDASLIEHFIRLMEEDSSAEVQQAAATALGRFVMLAEHQKLPPADASRLSQALLSTFDDNKKPVAVRRRALEAAAAFSLSQVEQSIIRAYQSSDTKLKVSAIHAMGKSCSPHWLPLLSQELASDDSEMRYEAACSCGDLGEGEAVGELISLTDDTDAEVRLVAIQALGKIGGREAKEHLQRCLDHPNEAVCQVAADALHEIEVIEEPLPAQDLDLGVLDDCR